MRFLLVALVVATLACGAAAAPLSENQYQWLFTKWVQQYSKQYEHDDFFYRYTIWKANFDYINQYNAQNNSVTLAINHMGDLSRAEFRQQYLGYTPIKNDYMRSQNSPHVSPAITITAPSAWDWRAKNAVTPVKNQQQCGSCWSFSATGSLEGAWAISKGNLVSLSEQELVDCSGPQGNEGCNGGLMDQAFEYVIANGLCTEASYPYTAADGTCANTKCTKAIKPAQISGYKDMSTDESTFLPIVAQQPLSIAIEADQDSFQFYSSGVLDNAACGTTLDHGVLIVGYGTDSGKDYWIVKNSWGATWGESGYIRMVRNKNECGLTLAASYPIVA